MQVDRDGLWQQIGMMMSDLDDLQSNEVRRRAAIQWWRDASSVLADVTRGFGPAPEPNETMARSWSELGLFIYFMLHPSCHGASDMVPPCPEAKHCFEQALKFAPGIRTSPAI